MTYHVATNRAGLPCVVDSSGVHDAMPSYLAATDEAQRRNRVLRRVQDKRAAREIARDRLKQYARQLGVSLRLMPEISDTSTWAARPTESAVCA